MNLALLKNKYCLWKLLNLNYVELVHSVFQVYDLLLLCIFILLIFEFDIETPTKKSQLSTLKKELEHIVEIHVTLFHIFQVSCKCAIIFS